MDGIPNINFYYVFTFFNFSFGFHDSGLVGKGGCHRRRFSFVESRLILSTDNSKATHVLSALYDIKQALNN